jgi:hypothetical protein
MNNDQRDSEARKAFRKSDDKRPMTEHKKQQRALQNNFELLKAERLAREAAKKDGVP